MATGERDETQRSAAAPPSEGKRERWYRRPTVRALKEESKRGREITARWDERDNDKTRLPPSEAIHLGGLVLTEAFTPSTVSSLYAALKRWPSERPERRQEWLEGLETSRRGSRGGWQNLGVVRPPGTLTLGDGHHDPDLPSGVDAVWLSVSYLTPSLAMVVATFTLTEESGELSGLLRQNYRTEHLDAWVQIYGRFGAVRARIPWSRPKHYRVGHSISSAEDQKRAACRVLISEYETACSRWFFGRFQGRFAAADPDERPVIRLVFTRDEVPFAARHAWFRPIGLDFALPLWRSSGAEDWWLADEQWPQWDRRYAMTLAARRADVAKEPSKGESGESNWYLTQRIGTDESALAARHAMTALLAIYSGRLGELRDKAGVRRFVRRPVRDARGLDDYLLRDGLDAATITSDIEMFTRDLTEFRWEVPEFTEHRDHMPEESRGRRAPLEYVPWLRDVIREGARRIASDTATTTANIRASAELRQAIANTRLQRFILALAVVAAAIAVVSLLTR